MPDTTLRAVRLRLLRPGRAEPLDVVVAPRPFRPESSAKLIHLRRALSQDRALRTNVQFRVCHDDRPIPLRLSVLDQSPISQGSTGADALRS